jgi:quercetin dioxygenase-like cupin family protein
VEILPFGPGLRRQPPQAGHGVAEQVIRSDERGSITELAFAPRAVLAPRSSPQEGLFVVIAGGGWVQVGEERAPVHHGEAVVWPAHVAHGAWTDGAHMRALLIELADGPQAVRLVHEGTATTLGSDQAPAAPGASGQASGPTPARGRLFEPTGRPEDHDPAEGEPW